MSDFVGFSTLPTSLISDSSSSLVARSLFLLGIEFYYFVNAEKKKGATSVNSGIKGKTITKNKILSSYENSSFHVITKTDLTWKLCALMFLAAKLKPICLQPPFVICGVAWREKLSSASHPELGEILCWLSLFSRWNAKEANKVVGRYF